MQLQFNPGSTIKLMIDRSFENERWTFLRMYYNLQALKQEFLYGCRPIIGLYGCFLKSPFGEQLLLAMGKDGNDNMLPIALAVVEVEKFDTWEWFLELLRTIWTLMV
ncbi:hypothetical protein ACH5RR_026441 [Cinchona calisaya]|uniref:MULE transposase domain-containing protein n=1 Tax=Cinchona calisaya TaxID=153742 RepID=A0ABD2Z3P6_9GENT